MIVNKILGNIRDYEAGERTVDPVWLEWYELEKKLLRLALRGCSSGSPAGWSSDAEPKKSSSSSS